MPDTWLHDARSAAFALEARPKRAGDGWLVRCPAHPDRNPSLHISPKQGEGFLVYCFGGCSFEAVCHALKARGIPMPYYQSGPDTGQQPDFPKPHRPAPPPARPDPYSWGDAFGTLPPLRRLRFDGRLPAAVWVYLDAVARPYTIIARYQDGAEKTYRPWSPWIHRRAPNRRVPLMRMPPAPRYLYRLPELLAHDPAVVLLVEGEKTADAARALFPDCLATTYMGGSQSVSKADFQPLRRHRVIVLPDHDQGGDYALPHIHRHLRAFGIDAPTLWLADEFPALPGERLRRRRWDLADPYLLGVTATRTTAWRRSLAADHPLHLAAPAPPIPDLLRAA